MGLKEYVESLSDADLNNDMALHYFDFKENRDHVITTYKYCLEDPNRLYSLYVDMGNTGHNVFEDAIRFKFIKLVECFKKVSNIMRVKFYGHLSVPNGFKVMNKEILEDDSSINYLIELIDDRNSIAHETDSYELFMFENQKEQIKADLDFLTCIFLMFIHEYENRMEVNLIKEQWTLLSKESDI